MQRFDADIDQSTRTVKGYAATVAGPLRSKRRILPKHILFGVLGLMTIFVLYHSERFIFHRTSNTWIFFYPVRWKLFFHALGGAIALVLGALQFSTRLRHRYPKLHRVCGRIYIGGVLVAAPMAVYLTFTHGIQSLFVETTVQSSLWVFTALMALIAARNRNFEIHRQWVMRSYAVTLIFVASRVLYAVPFINPSGEIGAERILWILVICALLIPQLIIDSGRLLDRRSR